MSLSAPGSPSRRARAPRVNAKWNMVASCSNVADPFDENLDQLKDPLKLAQAHALRVKRITIAKFFAQHKDEDLSLYIDNLRQFATSQGGLVDDEYRAIIWPILAEHFMGEEQEDDSTPSSSAADSDFESALSEVGEEDKSEEGKSEKSDQSQQSDKSNEGERISDEFEKVEGVKNSDLEELRRHKEWNQVELDVHRTLARFPPNITDLHREALQDELIPLIVRVLKTNPRFNYYQGFHDICLTVLLVCGVKDALKICTKLAKHGAFSRYLLLPLEQSVLKDLDLMYVILNRVEPQVEAVMREVRLGGLFALSWPLTWFSHDLRKYQQIVRLFDAFLAAQHPLLPIYTCASVVIWRKHEILKCEREMPFIHRLLSDMPPEVPLEMLISDALYMAKMMGPQLLKGRYMDEYLKKIAQPPSATHSSLVSAIPRYALQLAFVAGAAAASATAGYLLLTKYQTQF